MSRLIHAVCRAVTAATLLIILSAAVFLLPRAVGIVPYIVWSGSMEPAVHTGAIAFINVHDKEPEIGDIITFRLGEKAGEAMTVTHRVIGIEDGGFLTKGDANDGRDPFIVEKEQLVGTYLYQIPKAGFFLEKLDRKRLLAVVFWTILLNGAAALLSAAAEEGSRT